MEEDSRVSVILSVFAGVAHRRSGADLDVLVKLLDASAGRILRKTPIPDPQKGWSHSIQADIGHVADWIASSLLEDAAWLRRVDESGVPLKLAKCGTMQQLRDEVEKSARRKRTYGLPIATEDGLEKVHDCGDGFAVYRLRTAAQLDHEGVVMGHCVGEGAYDLGVKTGSTAIYSLRDARGKSHVTIEIDEAMGHVEQIKGKQNAAPKIEYMRRLVGWLGPELTYDLAEIPEGFAVDGKKGLVELAALRPGDEFHGDLSFAIPPEADHFPVPLPEGITIRGDLVIDGGDRINRMVRLMDKKATFDLPRGVVVSGALRIRGCAVALDEVNVGQLHLTECLVEKLPPHVSSGCEFESAYTHGAFGTTSFGGDVVMERCGPFALPPDTAIAGDLYISRSKKATNTSIDQAVVVGANTLCRGYVFLTNSDVAFAGDFSCGGGMTVTDCDDIALPTCLEVGGDLTVKNSFIDGWPASIYVAGTETYSYVCTHGERDTRPPRVRPGDAPPSSRPGL